MRKFALGSICLFCLIVFGIVLDNVHDGTIDLKKSDISRESCLELEPKSMKQMQGLGQIVKRTLTSIDDDIEEALLTSEIVLGYLNPDTVLIIDFDTTIISDFVLINNARLEFRDADINFRGNIWLMHNSQLIIEDANFTFLQEFIYQCGYFALDSAEVQISESRIHSGYMPLDGVNILNSKLFFSNVDMDGAFFTFSFMNNALLRIDESDGAGEFVFLGDNVDVEITNSDTILIWLGFPKGSSGEVVANYEEDELVESFDFPNDDVAGIDYRLHLENVSTLWMAAMIQDSTDVVIRDSELRACGMLYRTTEPETLSSFVNNFHYSDFTADISDRNFRLVNSKVQAWNHYAYESSIVTIESAIFGELLADSLSYVWIQNSICDGTGGHIGAHGHSQLFSVFTTLFTEAIVNAKATAFFYYTTFVGRGKIVAENSSISVCFNTPFIMEPIVKDSATVIDISINAPYPAYVNDDVIITGNSRMITGPESVMAFEGYRLEYYQTADTMISGVIKDRATEPVIDGNLAIFNTDDLEPAQYRIRKRFYFSYSGIMDSIDFDYDITLAFNEEITESPDTKKPEIRISPNPFIDRVKIDMPSVHDCSIEIYDLAGRKIDEATEMPYIWKPDSSLEPGIYLLKISHGTEIQVHRLIMMD